MNEDIKPWLNHYPAGLDWDTDIKRQPLYETLAQTAARRRDHVAIDFLDYCLTYGELLEQVNRTAKGLQAMGVKKGSRVGLCLPNTPYSVICYYGVLRAGGTVVNYNPLYVERELAFQIEDSKTEIMITMDLKILYSKVEVMLSQTPSLQKIVVCPMADILPKIKSVLFRLLKKKELATIPTDSRIIPFQTLVSHAGTPDPVDIDLDKDIAVLQYTGGTTGQPKGAMLTQGNLSANVSQMQLWYGELDQTQEKVLGILPFFHVFAMTAVMNFAIASGAQMILLPRYELKQTLNTIHKKKPTIFPAVPTIYASINQATNLSKFDLSTIRFCISGGAPLPLEVKETFERLTGCRLVEGYGLSETAPVATCNAMRDLNKPGSIGQVMPQTEISIHHIEPPHDPMPMGERGEVWIKGPQVMIGYLNRPEDNADSLRNGWFRTGDVGYVDSEGHFFLVDRLKDLILCSGYNVYPRMVEEAIYLHPSVAEVTVIGIDDEYRGQSPKAFVRLKEGQVIDESEMNAFLQDKLSKIEMPSQIEFRPELPKTIIGKLSKKELVAEESEKQRSLAE
ncbi:MAG: long-chain fatty acid--CoA ligase [Proteobacteria bacterium]|nr:long-chain fatty acid--CoA ligase [Pseudomonadota bacterium]MBT7813902.1 long-chain fatty acid--CoA ligase [Pseudomonadota bacterium]MBT7967321.1 long-chain fatty acid--CoA ligase [Pseudomonadota bacterium]